MPVEALSTTTLGEALDASKNAFALASTTNVSVGDYLVCRAEAMKVREVLNSTQVTVVRGVNGTKAHPHPSGKRLFVGGPHKFEAIKASATAMFGDSGTYPEFMLPGQRAMDAAGNEYILLDPNNATIYSGATVWVSTDGLFTCSVLYQQYQGSVAVLVEAATSGQYVWGQIYGANAFCQEGSKTSGITSAYYPVAQTSITSPWVGMAAMTDPEGEYLIYSMFISGVATTATTAATSATGVAVPVWLNYPYVDRFRPAAVTTGA